jgi:hypothetical protein
MLAATTAFLCAMPTYHQVTILLASWVQSGASKNLALLVFSAPDFIFWLKEGVYQ